MADNTSVRYCSGCGIEILLAPVVQDGKIFCCKDCADGLECECGKVQEQEGDQEWQ
jgi:hypothetical protein